MTSKRKFGSEGLPCFCARIGACAGLALRGFPQYRKMRSPERWIMMCYEDCLGRVACMHRDPYQRKERSEAVQDRQAGWA